VEVFGGEGYATDNSVANGSSIAFVFEYDGVRCLLTGDGVAPVLSEGLSRFAAESGSLPFDLVKLPHHGSRANLDEQLLALMPSDRFLISTNGARYRHPDRTAIDLLLERSKLPPKLYFNYDCETTSEWKDPQRQEDRGYEAIYPSNGSGITVVLGS
jgi:beta-lactamase superfamily II metal-dependent hydrolase